MLKIYLNLSEIYSFAHDLRRLQVFFSVLNELRVYMIVYMFRSLPPTIVV